MQALGHLGQDVLYSVDGLLVLCCQGGEKATYHLGLGLWYLLSALCAIVADGLFHGCRIHEGSICHGDDTGDLCLLGSGEYHAKALLLATLLPLCHEALHNPETCDVLQEADTATHTALVGEFGLAGFFGEDGLGQFETKQRPCAGTEKGHGTIALDCRYGGYGRGRVVRTYGNNLYLAKTCLLGNIVAKGTANTTGHYYFAKYLLGQSQSLDGFPRPLSALGIEEFGGGGYAILVVGLSGEEIAEQVGHEQKVLGRLELGSALDAEQLCQSVYLHHLNAGGGIVLGGGECLKEFPGHAGGASISIAYGIANKLAVAVNQTEVHAPGVHTNTFNLVTLCSRFLQSYFHVLEQGRKIPMDMVAKANLTVAETVNLLHDELAILEPTGYNATTTATEVCGKIYFAHSCYLIYLIRYGYRRCNACVWIVLPLSAYTHSLVYPLMFYTIGMYYCCRGVFLPRT